MANARSTDLKTDVAFASPVTRSQPPLRSHDGDKLDMRDIFIVVMGVTGAGKSTFISQCTDSAVAVGHQMDSCTQTVNVYQCNFTCGSRTVWLVDTPGFDDTYRSDTEVLKEVASWFTMTYQQKITICGILYLHQITMNRMLGSSQKNLVMFYQLCGKNYFERVHIVTTRWDEVDEATGSRRESDLKRDQNHWGEMVRKGARVVRHQNTQGSAKRIIKRLIRSQEDQPRPPLNIQQQMVDEGKSLHETAAGAELRKELLEQEKRHEQERRQLVATLRDELSKELSARDRDLVRMLEEQKKEGQAQIEKSRRENEALQTRLQHEQEKKLQELAARLEASRRQDAALEKSRRENETLQTRLQQEQDKKVQELAARLEASMGKGAALEKRLGEEARLREVAVLRAQARAQAETQATQAELQAQKRQNQQLEQQRQAQVKEKRLLQQRLLDQAEETRRLQQDRNKERTRGKWEKIQEQFPPGDGSIADAAANPAMRQEMCTHPTKTADGHCDDCGRGRVDFKNARTTWHGYLP